MADILMLASGVGLSSWMSAEGFGEPSGLPAYVVATFFLFCNVARIGRPMELAWAGVATVTCVLAVAYDLPFWWTVLPVTVPATAAVVAWTYVAGRYNGVLAKPRKPLPVSPTSTGP